MAWRIKNPHSRFVAWTKITLPLIALFILSSLFLFSKSNDLSQVVALSPSDLKEFSQKERISEPRFGGMTPDGIAIMLSAAEASPRGTDGSVFGATDMKAIINLPDDTQISLTANRGEVNRHKRISRMTDGVTLNTSDGYIVLTRGLSFTMDNLDIKSEGSVVANGPLGHLTAGSFHLLSRTAPDKQHKTGYLLVFKNGVKLVYKPQEKVSGGK